MKVGQFIKWLEKQDQNLEVCVIESSTEEESGREVMVVQSVCFDDPAMQSSRTNLCLILGVE